MGDGESTCNDVYCFIWHFCLCQVCAHLIGGIVVPTGLVELTWP